MFVPFLEHEMGNFECPNKIEWTLKTLPIGGVHSQVEEYIASPMNQVEKHDKTLEPGIKSREV